MVHRGEKIELAVRNSGMTISEVARRMNKSRRHLYNIFEHPRVSIDVILHISKIIHYDFTKEIPELKKDKTTQVLNDFDTPYKETKNATYWKDKYLALLERHNQLLEERGKVYLLINYIIISQIIFFLGITFLILG